MNGISVDFAAMKIRTFGRTGWQVSEIGFGGWGIGGGQWGGADEAESMATLHAALDQGINFFDTADVYGDGLSERLIARLRRERREPFYVATKAGRRLPAQTAAGYSRENLTAFIDRSLKNLEVETLDLVQLHCPPTEVYYRPEVFGILDDLVAAGKIRCYGVSVEKVEEAHKAIYSAVHAAYTEQADIRHGAARGWVDRIIEPHRTREELVAALQAAAQGWDYSAEFKTGVLQT